MACVFVFECVCVGGGRGGGSEPNIPNDYISTCQIIIKVTLEITKIYR